MFGRISSGIPIFLAMQGFPTTRWLLLPSCMLVTWRETHKPGPVLATSHSRFSLVSFLKVVSKVSASDSLAKKGIMNSLSQTAI